MASCSNCGSPIPPTADRCPTCGADAGSPNVRAAETLEEKAALDLRFDEALLRAESRGTKPDVERFVDAMSRSVAVVNCDLSFLKEFVTKSNALYSNYHRGVLAQVRKAAESQLDRDRTAADALLFGSYGAEIRFAALSLTGSGLSSYGLYAMKLREVAVARRSSLLEENSFNFIQRHKITIRTPIPAGHRSTWNERAKLATAKLADLITTGMGDSSFQAILLVDRRNRELDEFVEVHIFGPFDRDAIESVMGPPPKGTLNYAAWEVVKENLRTLGKKYYET